MAYSAKTNEEIQILIDTEEILKALLIDTLPVSKGGFRKGGNFNSQEYNIKRILDAFKAGQFPDSYEYYLPYYAPETGITAKDKIDRNFKTLKRTVDAYISGKRIYSNYKLYEGYQYCIIIKPKDSNDTTQELTIAWDSSSEINNISFITNININMLTSSGESQRLQLNDIKRNHKRNSNQNDKAKVIDTYIITKTMSLISSFFLFYKNAITMWGQYAFVPFIANKRSERYYLDFAKLLLISTTIVTASICSLKFVRRFYDFDYEIDRKLTQLISLEYAVFALLFIVAVSCAIYLTCRVLGGNNHFYDTFKHLVIISVTITCLMSIMEITLNINKDNPNWFIFGIAYSCVIYVATIPNYTMLKKISNLSHFRTIIVFTVINFILIALKYPLLLKFM